MALHLSHKLPFGTIFKEFDKLLNKKQDPNTVKLNQNVFCHFVKVFKATIDEFAETEYKRYASFHESLEKCHEKSWKSDIQWDSRSLKHLLWNDKCEDIFRQIKFGARLIWSDFISQAADDGLNYMIINDFWNYIIINYSYYLGLKPSEIYKTMLDC